MPVYEKPPRMRLREAARSYFERNPEETVVCLLTKEGREFWFGRDPLTGEPVKVPKPELA